MQQLVKEVSAFHEISVCDTSELYGETGKYRILQFSDGAVQGAADLKDPQRVVLEYQRGIIHLMECNDPDFDSVFIIGHGIGTIAGQYPGKWFVTAELDEKIVELSRQFFGYRSNNVVIGDGRQILAEQQPGSFHYIILDAFSSKGTPQHLTTLEFFQLAMDKLAQGGAVILNLAGKLRNDRLSAAVYTTLSEAFAYVRAFFLPATRGRSEDYGNLIIAGSNRPIEGHARLLAGFVEVRLEQGYIIRDS